MRFRVALAFLIVIASGFAACSEDESSESAATCARDVDCPAGRICETGRCVQSTIGSGGTGGAGGSGAADSGSSASGGGPSEAGGDAGDSGGGTACTTDAECTGGMLCIALECRATGACTAATDRTAVEAEYDVPGDGGTRRLRVRDIARECGIDCLINAPSGTTDAELAACTHACILETTDQALSGGCAFCLVETVNCGRTHCLTQCIDPTNLNCIPCICGENLQRVNCTARFEACAGVPSTTCDQVPDAT